MSDRRCRVVDKAVEDDAVLAYLGTEAVVGDRLP